MIVPLRDFIIPSLQKMSSLKKVWVNHRVLQKHVWMVKLWNLVNHNVHFHISLSIVQCEKLPCTHFVVRREIVPILHCYWVSPVFSKHLFNLCQKIFMAFTKVAQYDCYVQIRRCFWIESIDAAPIHENLVRF